LISKINVENCIELLILGDLHQAKNLKKTAFEFFKKNNEKFDSYDWESVYADNPRMAFDTLKCLIKSKI